MVTIEEITRVSVIAWMRRKFPDEMRGLSDDEVSARVDAYVKALPDIVDDD